MSKKIVDLTSMSKSGIVKTSTGYDVKILGLSQTLFDAIRNSVVMPDPPTYDITTVSGAIEKHYHTETTLDTEEDKTSWLKYLVEKKSAETDMQYKIIKAMIVKGIEITEKDNTWVEVQEFIGLTIPTIPMERKYHFVMSEVIGTENDMLAITEAVMELTGVPKEVLEEARASFRSQVGK